MRVRPTKLREGARYRLMGLVQTYEGRTREGHHRFEDSFGGETDLTDRQVRHYARTGAMERVGGRIERCRT